MYKELGSLHDTTLSRVKKQLIYSLLEDLFSEMRHHESKKFSRKHANHACMSTKTVFHKRRIYNEYHMVARTYEIYFEC